MNRNLVTGAIVGALVVIGSMLYMVGIITPSKSTSSFPPAASEETSSMNDGLSYQVVKENMTVYDQAAHIPCETIIHHCPTQTGRPSSTAQLIKYDGTYYYRTFFGVTTSYSS